MVKKLGLIRTKRVSFLIFLCIALFVLGGCPRQYYIHLKDSSDLKHPVFCLTENSMWCGGSGIQQGIFFVEELNDDGEIIDDAWMIEHESGLGKIYEIRYGEAPEGYRVVYKAKELELNNFYRINGESVIKLFRNESDNKLDYIFMSYSDFHAKLRKKWRAEKKEQEKEQALNENSTQN